MLWSKRIPSSIQKQPAGMKGTQIDIQCTSIVHLPNQIYVSLPCLSISVRMWVNPCIYQLLLMHTVISKRTNERLTDWTCTFMHFMCGKPFFSWFTIISNARAHFALHLRKYARGNIETKQFFSPCHLPTIVCITNEMNNDEWNRYMFTTQGF